MKIRLSISLFLLTIPIIAQSSDSYQDSIQVEIQKIVSDSVKAKKYYKASLYALQRISDLKLSRKYADSAMHYSQVSNFADSEAKCYFLYGLLERINGNYEVALKHLAKNIHYFKNDSINKSYALFQVGTIHLLKGDYKKSLSTYLEILKIFESKKDSFAIASTLNSIGNIYGEMNKYDKAIENYSRAKEIFVEKNKQRDVSNAYQNIGEIYFRKKDTLAAKENMQKSLIIANEINELYAKANALFGLGRVYLHSQPEKSFEYLKESESVLEKINYNSLKVKVYQELGRYFKNRNNNEKALLYYKQALALAEDLDELPSKEESLKKLSAIYKGKNQFKKAYNYLSKYLIVKDSLLNKENLKSINLLQTQFETEKKDNEIIQQQLQLEKKEGELQIKKTQTSFLVGISFFLLVASILAWFLFQQRQKRKDQEIVTLKREHQIKTLESLIEGEEKERFRIAKELHDGVNGDLSAIKYKLSSLLEMNNTVIKEAISMIDNSCSQVRAISHNLVPPSLDNFNLIEAVEEYCEKSNASHAEKITFQHLGDRVEMSKKEEINVFRIIQELVTNSIKHAKATEIDVQISCRNKIMQITVEDNGVGFDVHDAKSNGIGLKNIQSRVDYLHANLDILANKNGTSTTVEIDKSK